MSAQQIQSYARGIAECMTYSMADLWADQGLSLTVPNVYVFSGSVQTGCGTETHYAFYCSPDQSIYLRDDIGSERSLGKWAGGLYMIMAHEYAHHMQFRSGIMEGRYRLMEQTNSQSAQDAITRRNELQAQCFAGVWLSGMEHLMGNGLVYQNYLQHMSYTGDPQRNGRYTHGSTEAQTFWFRSGYEWEINSYGRCNTYIASKHVN